GLGAVCLAVAAAFVWRSVPSTPMATAAAQSEPSPPHVAEPSAAPSPPSAAPARSRVVSVGVTPMDARVEVHGQPSTVEKGFLRLVGDLGSVHRVRVVRGAQALASEVIITEQGARPEHISLPVLPAPPPKPGTRPPPIAAPTPSAVPGKSKPEL